jgi:hypothetical protein
VTALSICFSGGRRLEHHSASGDCTDHKRFLMQQCLCCFRRYHCSYDLCWSSWWRQRCMPGNRVMIRLNIYTWKFRICYKHKTVIYNHCEVWLKYFRSSVQLKSRALLRCTNTNVDLKSTCLFVTSYFIYPDISLVIYRLLLKLGLQKQPVDDKIITGYNGI